jgi:acetyl esterase/lipase
MGWLVAAGAGVTGTALVAKRARKMAPVAPELRSPLLYVPLNINALTRPLLKQLSAARTNDPAGVKVTTHHVPRGAGEAATRLLVCERAGSSGVRPVLFWMHGGGYVLGTPEQDMTFIERLLARFDIVVATVDYRLAPDHPYPAPLDDCHAALSWVVDQAEDLGVDTTRVIIGGQSAGGGLAAALVQRTVDQGPIKPIFQVLVYPMLDAMTVARKDDSGTGDFIWTSDSNRYGWQSYLGRDPTSGNYPPYAVSAARTDLSRLPPAWLGVGTLDLFHAEDLAYARRLKQAGVDCELYEVDGAYHAFNVLCPDAEPTRRFNESMFVAIERALS